MFEIKASKRQLSDQGRMLKHSVE
ncbi:MAG: hypothetical protein RL711_1996, partial [Bacteroidota bacterium]